MLALITGELKLLTWSLIPILNIKAVEDSVGEAIPRRFGCIVSVVSFGLIGLTYLIAYGLYSDQQTMTFGEVLVNALPADDIEATSNSVFGSMFYTAAWIAISMVIIGILLPLPLWEMLAPARVAVYNAAVIWLYYLGLMWLIGLKEMNLKALIFCIAYVVEIPTAATVFIYLIVRRMGADRYEMPVLALAEVGLGARALGIAMQGNATIVNLPAPHWVVAYGPALLLITAFGAVAINQFDREVGQPGWQSLTGLRFLLCIGFMIGGGIISAGFR